MDLQYNLRRDVAKATGQDFDSVERISRSLFEFVAQQMEAGQLKAVRLPHFGLFYCKRMRVEKLIEAGKLPESAILLLPVNQQP